MMQYFKQNRILLLHLVFWGLYFSFFFYQITYPRRGVEPDYTKATMDAIAQVLFMAAISYLNYFILLPRFAKHKNTFKYILELFVPLLILGLIHIWLKRELWIVRGDPKMMNYFQSMRFVSQHYISTIFIVGFISMLRFAKDWFELEAKRKEIENEKLISELRFLKEQINPHFLFNTLNNLYYLAHTQSPNTKEVISKLSQMMRYMIYEANSEKVAVSKEIEYIRNYIDLEKLRLEDNVPIVLTVEGNYEQLKITPLIFITYLENAFKHGVSQTNNDAWVNVSIKFEGNKCIYHVSNSVVDGEMETVNTGIGLSNTKRRLNLSYNGKHKLTTERKNNQFEVKLEVDL
ncbi:Histidine kinase [Spirosomataceae bacterium TFI 002]|nr:Histidine kinase [Spirosomataceae bacterium TFI 002]